MHIYTIYRATNTINGKVYIGFDSAWPKRKSEHKTAIKYGDNFKFYNAIRKYGWDCFVWEVIYQSLDYDHCLNTMEPFFIIEHGSLADGYNGNSGGGRGALGAKWWNNGITQVHTQVPPDQSFKEGRLKFNNTGAAMGAAVNAQKYWINNGESEMMIFKIDPLPPGWSKGRLLSKAFNGYNRSQAKGVSWWNNGLHEKMARSCPGQDYSHGRLKLQHTLIGSNLQ